jgi:hypothetical protein
LASFTTKQLSSSSTDQGGRKCAQASPDHSERHHPRQGGWQRSASGACVCRGRRRGFSEDDLRGPRAIGSGARAARGQNYLQHGFRLLEVAEAMRATFKFAIYLKTAKALGLSVPYSMQLLAEEVIE